MCVVKCCKLYIYLVGCLGSKPTFRFIGDIELLCGITLDLVCTKYLIQPAAGQDTACYAIKKIFVYKCLYLFSPPPGDGDII